mmetsp:Transcript_12895/g.28004  ORF Transcript_12895/g.28004 Transcript_12895/m.28004 type:complete len:215 (-) Transcript_12895:555-1199(-)
MIEHFFQARNILGRTEQRLVQIGGVPSQRVHNDLVQSRSEVGRRIVIQIALLLVHRRLSILVNGLDVIGHIVNPIVQCQPLNPLLVQPHRGMTQHPPFVIPKELLRPIRPRRERVTGDTQQYIQIAKARTRRIGKIIVRSVNVHAVRLDLCHVQTLLRQCHGRSAWKYLGTILAEIIHNALDSPRMSIDEILHVVDASVDDHPILPTLCPYILH